MTKKTLSQIAYEGATYEDDPTRDAETRVIREAYKEIFTRGKIALIRHLQQFPAEELEDEIERLRIS